MLDHVYVMGHGPGWVRQPGQWTELAYKRMLGKEALPGTDDLESPRGFPSGKRLARRRLHTSRVEGCRQVYGPAHSQRGQPSRARGVRITRHSGGQSIGAEKSTLLKRHRPASCAQAKGQSKRFLLGGGGWGKVNHPGGTRGGKPPPGLDEGMDPPGHWCTFPSSAKRVWLSLLSYEKTWRWGATSSRGRLKGARSTRVLQLFSGPGAPCCRTPGETLSGGQEPTCGWDRALRSF